MSQRFRVLSYNIHKGFTVGNLRFILEKIKQSIQVVHADVVCLQEVVGDHTRNSEKVKNWPITSQFEFLADQIWSHFAYGKNAVYTEGHHGNAVLSKFPITHWKNQDISLTPFENRGLLHTIVQVPDHKLPLHIFCVHLSLMEKDRQAQMKILSQKIHDEIPPNEPIIVAGDFNDWRQNASHIIFKSLNMKEASLGLKGRHSLTFPSRLPFFALDRIYYRHLKCINVEVLKKGLWAQLSDHLPTVAEFELDLPN